VTFTEAFEQESYLHLTNGQSGNPSDAEDQRRQEETLQQVSIFSAAFLSIWLTDWRSQGQQVYAYSRPIWRYNCDRI
jgi:hypothetical protein